MKIFQYLQRKVLTTAKVLEYCDVAQNDTQVSAGVYLPLEKIGRIQRELCSECEDCGRVTEEYTLEEEISQKK